LEFSNEQVSPLLAKLESFQPNVITYEGLAGSQCEFLHQNEQMNPGVFDSYCWSAAEAQKALGKTLPQATFEIEKMLGGSKTAPSTSQRRTLAALFLAANDRPSAQVQWTQLAASEQHIGDGLDLAMVKILERVDAKPNETYAIAVSLAARLQLNRVYAIDDHTADAALSSVGPKFEEAMKAVWHLPKRPLILKFDQLKTALKTGADLLNLIRFLNEPNVQMEFAKADFGEALKQQTDEQFGRQYVSWWETRNLRMVSNIRSAAANVPGAKVLNVVGASHKPYFDSYMRLMSDVQVVDTKKILK
jgi:hypothetical protein